MVEAQDRDGQNSTSMMAFAQRHGYAPATVTAHEKTHDGMTLITLDSDYNTNIKIYDDGRPPHRVGETPEWAEEE